MIISHDDDHDADDPMILLHINKDFIDIKNKLWVLHIVLWKDDTMLHFTAM